MLNLELNSIIYLSIVKDKIIGIVEHNLILLNYKYNDCEKENSVNEC